MSFSSVPICIRPLGSGAKLKWVALNRQDRGFASFGYSFDTLGEALDRFEARVTAWGRDQYGLYLLAK